MIETPKQKDNKDNWKSKWIIIKDIVFTDNGDPIICENCNYCIGRTNTMSKNEYPKMCPSCKHDMENGVKRYSN